MMKQLYKAYAFSFYFTYADKVRCPEMLLMK